MSGPETRKLMICRIGLDISATTPEESDGSTISKPAIPVLIGTDEPEFSYVAAAIEKTIELLHTPKAISVLIQTAQTFMKYKPDAKMPFKTVDDVPKWVKETFLHRIRTQFPLVIIDPLTAGRVLATTERRHWGDNLWGKGNYLTLNKHNMSLMKQYAGYGDEFEDLPTDPKRYQECMAALILELLHEVGGHTLVGHIITDGRDLATPVEMRDEVMKWDPPEVLKYTGHRGESGFWFVNKLFEIDVRVRNYDAKLIILLRKINRANDNLDYYHIAPEKIEALLKGNEGSFANGLGIQLEVSRGARPVPIPDDEIKSHDTSLKYKSLPLQSGPAQTIITGKNAKIHIVPFDPKERVEISHGQEESDKRRHESSSESETGLRGGPAAGTSKASKAKKQR